MDIAEADEFFKRFTLLLNPIKKHIEKFVLRD